MLKRKAKTSANLDSNTSFRLPGTFERSGARKSRGIPTEIGGEFSFFAKARSPFSQNRWNFLLGLLASGVEVIMFLSNQALFDEKKACHFLFGPFHFFVLILLCNLNPRTRAVSIFCLLGK